MPPIPEVVKRYVLGRDDWKCRNCGRRDWLDPHHVTFRSRGGSNHPNNLVTLCRVCHEDIHDGRMFIEVTALLEYDLQINFRRVS